MGRRVGEPVPEHLLEIRQAIGATEPRLVPIEDQPRGKGQGLRDDREVHPFDAAAKRQKAKDRGEEHRHQDGPHEPAQKALERVPEQGEFFDLGPHHEVGQFTAIHALFADLEG